MWELSSKGHSYYEQLVIELSEKVKDKNYDT